MTAQSLVPPGWQIPQAMRQRLGTTVGRQRAMFHDEHLLLILHQPPTGGETQRRPRLFWREPNGTWHCSDFGSGPNSLQRHLDQFADAVSKLDRAEELAQSADGYFQLLEALMPVTRTARNLHQVLQEARQKIPADRDIINSRDRAYEIDRTAELLEAQLQHRLDYAVARRAEEQAEASHQLSVQSHRLNLLAALLLPLATLCAIFGMEIPHGLDFVPGPMLFFGIVGAGLVCGAVLMALMTLPVRRRERPEKYGIQRK